MIKKIFKNYGHYIYLYIFSCFTLSLCSHFSPFYKYNFSGDPSIYFTIGRGIMHGLVPYKDLLDIKGPIIFFLYALFSPIKLGTNYFGIFILETIALWISITFIYKTIALVSKSSKWAFILSLIYPFILLNQDAFITGGEAEEFILPFIFILIYYTFVIIQNNFHATRYQYLFIGFSVSFVFWIKYTCLGAWIAFYFCMFIYFFIHKNYHEFKKIINYSLLGFSILSVPIIGYFLMNHAFNDLLWGYFGWNYIYGGSTHEGLANQLIFIIIHSFFIFFKRYIIIWFLVIAMPYLAIIDSTIVKNLFAKIMLISMIFCSISLELSGGLMFPYYQQMSIPFVTITFCWFALKLKTIKVNKIIISIISIISLAGTLIVNPSIKQSNLTGYIPYQERFAKIMTKNNNVPTVLDFNEVEQGWYNYLNILPPTKYFTKLNTHNKSEYLPYKKNQLYIIKNKKVKYIIYSISKNPNNNKLNKIALKYYQIIDRQKIYNDKNTSEVLLLKSK